MKKLIAPSVLAADFSRLGEEIQKVEKAGADLLHLDIMDGHFVPNLTIGPSVAQAVRKITGLPLDCHLMTERPEKYISPFCEAGANWISVHVETCEFGKLAPLIRGFGCKAGIAISPPTQLEKIYPLLKLADFIVLMTVNPGFAGQKLVEGTLEKLRTLKEFLDSKSASIPIEVDGAIKADNIGEFSRAGADIFVSGSGIFRTINYQDTIAKMRYELGWGSLERSSSPHRI